jgi:site-specific recombinase XerD
MNVDYEFLGGQNSDETVRAYKTDLEQFQVIAGGELTRGGVILFRDELLKQGLSPSTVARKMSTIRSYCEFLRGQGKLSIDPFAGVKAPKVSVSEPTQAFTDDEVRKMFKVVEKTQKPVERERDKLVLGFLFYAGLRRSEIASLKFSDIKELEGQIVIRVFGKGGKYRMIPAHPKLAEMLLPHLVSTPLWPKASDRSLLDISGGTIYAIVKKYAKMVGVTRSVSPHSCRATAISQLLENGESPRNVADFAGHASVNTTIGSYDKKRDGIKNSAAMKLRF